MLCLSLSLAHRPAVCDNNRTIGSPASSSFQTSLEFGVAACPQRRPVPRSFRSYTFPLQKSLETDPIAGILNFTGIFQQGVKFHLSERGKGLIPVIDGLAPPSRSQNPGKSILENVSLIFDIRY